MDFEDENPFTSDPPLSSASSTSHVNVSPPPPATNLPSSPTSRPPFPSPGSNAAPRQPAQKSDYCCFRDQWLHSGEDVEILIIDAVKTSENATSPYITYLIRAGNATARHRYSEFEALRVSLTQLYPTLIIPPIPSKQTLGDYAIKQGKAKEDAAMIARRRRMLQTFLNRIARHPILANEHVFHRFLDGDVSWVHGDHTLAAAVEPPEEPPQGARAQPDGPERVARIRGAAEPERGAPAAAPRPALPRLGGVHEQVCEPPRRADGEEYAQDHMDLGAAWNGFSLNEHGELSAAIERTGQAIDATYMSTTRLDLEQNWQEPLHEYTQFAGIIKKLLMYRHQKHVQLEMTQDALEARREALGELEKSEREARRLEEAVGNIEPKPAPPSNETKGA
ncbi:hypothetical protein EWM64_g9397 [Hericium alpestre]|uniref:PX domain-containing protein n=1 Tax=Hericium alpestre TaxID=135208 RepID=A0A4Y9ZJ60_9AGAM|nr:hypothetical protein EWM64_g9397 [Hericium alpestre]